MHKLVFIIKHRRLMPNLISKSRQKTCVITKLKLSQLVIKHNNYFVLHNVCSYKSLRTLNACICICWKQIYMRISYIFIYIKFLRHVFFFSFCVQCVYTLNVTRIKDLVFILLYLKKCFFFLFLILYEILFLIFFPFLQKVLFVI